MTGSWKEIKIFILQEQNKNYSCSFSWKTGKEQEDIIKGLPLADKIDTRMTRIKQINTDFLNFPNKS